MLPFIIAVLLAMAVGALAGFAITYHVQREKIHQIKKSFRTAIREEASQSYKAGCEVTTAALKETHAKELKAMHCNGYNDGYSDGVGNEQYIRENKAKHLSVADDDTKVMQIDELTAILPMSDITMVMSKVQQ